MNISDGKIKVGNFELEVVRKDIKNMHLAVYPPMGRVRVSAPERMDDESIRLFAVSKISWIKKHQKRFREQEREAPREYVNGESHYFLGKRYLLRVIEHSGNNKVVVRNKKFLELYVKHGADQNQRARAMKEWYRRELKKIVPQLLEIWQDEVGVEAKEWGIKAMRTKWGTCNEKDRRIWLNLELTKKPIACIEYIIVHELVHFFERNHNDRFVAYMDRFMPNWRLNRETLNRLPVKHEDWSY
ncbi:MAG: M48 family metallopeptidase [Flavobacteriales bacterium]|nr:M48 family metallopeptidase [Flavobacteriales bacterium]